MIVEEMEKNLILDSIWIGKNSAPNCSVYHSYKVCSDDIEYVRKDVARKEVIENATKGNYDSFNKPCFTRKDIYDAYIKGIHQAKEEVIEEVINKACDYFRANHYGEEFILDFCKALEKDSI